MMDEKIVNLLKNQLWYLATCDGGEPNAVPVGFKKVAEDGTLLIGDVFFKVTLKNLLANANVSISACDAASGEGYQVKGTAEYFTDGSVFEEIKALGEELFHGKLAPKGAVRVTPRKAIVTTPGPDNNKVTEY